MYIDRLLLALLIGALYSYAGYKYRSQIRNILIPIILAIAVICYARFSWKLLYPVLIALSFNIGYGNNCPLQKILNKIGWTDYNKTKWLIRAINALAIAGSAITLLKWPVFAFNMAYFVPFYVWLTCTNPCKDLVIWKWKIEAARVEEFLVGLTAVLIPLMSL